MHPRRLVGSVLPVLLLSTCGVGFGQTSLVTTTLSRDRTTVDQDAARLPDAPMPARVEPATPPNRIEGRSAQYSAEAPTLTGLPGRFLKDELAVFSSPAHIRRRDLIWLLPVAGASAAAFSTDTKAMREVVSRDPSFNSSASTSSDVIRGLFIGAPVAMYGGGLLIKDEHARETGLLAGEAMIDAYVADVAIKYVTLRERPYLNNARGHFFTGDAVSDPSFVSGHSVVVWSSAAVLAAEYSRPWQQVAIYTLATGGSLTRVLGQDHFPSDALLGSVTGWLIGHYVYRAHHYFVKK